MTAFCVWLACSASYMILAGQFSPDEMVVAALLGAVGVVCHRALLGTGASRFSFEPRAALVIARSVAGLPLATLTVGRRLAAGLMRPVEGRRVERVFAHGQQGRPLEAGRRAVVVLATSLSPDAFVLRAPLDEDTLLSHALTESDAGRDPRWPAP